VIICNITASKIPTDRPYDGFDIGSILFENGERPQQSFLYYNHDQARCYRSGDWKVKIPFTGNEPARWRVGEAAHDTLLYNVKQDPGESINLFENNKSMARTLLLEMEQAKQQLGKLPEPILLRAPADHSHYEHVANRRKKAGKPVLQ